jgi:N-acetylneuraminate synthase
MDPIALADLIQGARNIFKARGGEKIAVEAEAPTIAFAFASVIVTTDLDVGATLSEENLWLRRPGGGDFNATDYDRLIGRKLKCPISQGQRLTKAHLSEA